MSDVGAPGLVAVRDMAVSPDQIWAAWINPAAIARWWGPAGFTSTVRELDVRAGGRFDVVMHGPDGTDFPNVYVFDEVEPGRRLRYTNQGSVEHGLAPFSSVVDIAVVDDDRAGGVGPPVTRVTLTAWFASEEDRWRHVEEFGAIEGSRQLLERLELLAGERAAP